MLSGNGQAGQLFEVVDAGLADIHYGTNMDQPDHYQTTYDSKTKIVVCYSLSNAFDLTSWSKFIENVDQNILKWTWVTPVY